MARQPLQLSAHHHLTACAACTRSGRSVTNAKDTMNLPDPATRQTNVRAPFPGDDKPTAITRRQAQQCAAIVAAYRRGHTGYATALDDVHKFLLAAGLSGQHSDTASLAHLAQTWDAVDAWPWPVHGAPRTQPD